MSKFVALVPHRLMNSLKLRVRFVIFSSERIASCAKRGALPRLRPIRTHLSLSVGLLTHQRSESIASCSSCKV